MEYAWFQYWSSESLNIFKSKILKLIRPKANSFFNCLNPKGVKLITGLWLGLSHLRDHKFKHCFQDWVNPMMQVWYWSRNNCSFSASPYQLLRWKNTKCLSFRLWTTWLWVRVPLQSLKLQISRLFWTKSSLTFRQLFSVDSLWNAYVHDRNIQSIMFFSFVIPLSTTPQIKF